MSKGILLVNLGSPDSTNVEDVRTYLREFLMDKKVLDSPWIIRKTVVELFILPKRPIKSAEAYRKIWTKDGSPLIVISKILREMVQKQMDIPVVLAMRYKNPSIEVGYPNFKSKHNSKQTCRFPVDAIIGIKGNRISIINSYRIIIYWVYPYRNIGSIHSTMTITHCISERSWE